MALTIGQQLRAAREEKGLSIEDLAHETRIHSNFVRALEADDYSGFASITYAKSFLQLYSRHLDIDASEALSVFNGSNTVNLHGSSLLSDSHESIEPMGSPMTSRSSKQKRRNDEAGRAPLFLGLILGVLLIAIPTFYFLGYNAENPEDVAKVIAQNANELKENIGAAAKSNGTDEIQVNPLAHQSETPNTNEETTTPPQSVAEVVAPEEQITPSAPIVGNVPPRAEPIIIEESPIESGIGNDTETPEKPSTPETETPMVAKPVDNGIPNVPANEADGQVQSATSNEINASESENSTPGNNSNGSERTSERSVKPIVNTFPKPSETTTGLPPVTKIPRDKPRVSSTTGPAPKPSENTSEKSNKQTAPSAPLRATPIIARPIVKPKPEEDPDLTELLPDDEERGTNEEPDAEPMEDITPKPKKLNFNPGANRFPRRPE